VRIAIRSKLMIAMMSLSSALTLALLAIVWSAHEASEQEAFDLVLKAEMAGLSEHLLSSGGKAIHSGTISGFLVAPGARPDPTLPEPFRALSPGVHTGLTQGEREYYLEVRDLPRGRLYVLVDVSDLDPDEQRFMLIIVGCGLGFLLLEWLIIQQITRRLVQALERLSVTVSQVEPGSVTRIDNAYPETELRQIADTFNAHLDRMKAFVEREQGLSAMISHELRTPLAVISGAADVLLSRAGDERNRHTVNRIKLATRDMTDSIDALMLLARSTDKLPQPLKPSRVDLLTEEAAAQLALTPSGKPVELRFGVMEALEVAAPARLISILVSNLVRNALQYTQAGHVLMQVSAEPAQLSVSDTGPGVDPDEITGLFRALTRGRDAQGSGAGLGLYIVDEICKRCGWSIGVDSGVGIGTTIRIAFQPPR
jgi:signal transduction histidine kinase